MRKKRMMRAACYISSTKYILTISFYSNGIWSCLLLRLKPPLFCPSFSVVVFGIVELHESSYKVNNDNRRTFHINAQFSQALYTFVLSQNDFSRMPDSFFYFNYYDFFGALRNSIRLYTVAIRLNCIMHASMLTFISILLFVHVQACMHVCMIYNRLN